MNMPKNDVGRPELVDLVGKWTHISLLLTDFETVSRIGKSEVVFKVQKMARNTTRNVTQCGKSALKVNTIFLISLSN